MQLKFSKIKRSSAGGYRWDTPMVDNRFYRIVTERNGLFAVYLCEGLHENGITPLKMTGIFRSAHLKACMERAQDHANKSDAKNQKPEGGGSNYNGVPDWYRHPYKD